ncbi:MAG: RnfABCDGE type electron transport complex subunit D [Ruminococcaceae bacterium]|nr:RnfABCDGE type electron transport complex subunit D [Oscillospiraceae bacterium]
MSNSEKTFAAKSDEDIKIAKDEKRSLFGKKYRSIYGDQLICLCALLIMAVWRWGLRALVICGASVIVSIIADRLFCKMTGKTYNPKDLSTVVSGMCLGLLMPATVEYGYIIFGAALAMGIKHIFGGKNNYIFNPACVSYAFLAICWPSQVLMFPKIGDQIPVFGSFTGTLYSGLESYLVRLGTAQEMSASDIFMGNFLGPIGTTHVLILTVCGICLICRRALSPTVTLVTFAAFTAGTFLFPMYDNVNASIVIELICGNILFGLIFLANDPQTLPHSFLGKIYYGIVIGVLLVFFRHLTSTESSFVYVLLIANAVSLHIDLFADKTIVVIKNTFKWLKNSSGSFERVRKEAQNGEKNSLGDTQEIIVPLLNYNMPAVDNKIIKASKKPPKIVRDKNNLPVRKENKQENKESFLSGLRKNLHTKNISAAAKPEDKKSVKTPRPIKQPRKNDNNKNGKND